MRKKHQSTALLFGHKCVTGTDWSRFIQDAFSRPEKLILHTVILPPDCDPNAVGECEIIHERAYKLKPGEISEYTLQPSTRFDAFVDDEVLRDDCSRTLPRFVSVLSSGAERLSKSGREKQPSITSSVRSATQKRVSARTSTGN